MLKVVRDTGVHPCLYGMTWELALKAICGYVCFPSILGCLTDFWAELLRLFCEVGQVSIVFLSFLSVGRRQVSFPWQKWRSHRQLCPRRVVSCAGLPAIMSSVCWHFYQRQIHTIMILCFVMVAHCLIRKNYQLDEKVEYSGCIDSTGRACLQAWGQWPWCAGRPEKCGLQLCSFSSRIAQKLQRLTSFQYFCNFNFPGFINMIYIKWTGNELILCYYTVPTCSYEYRIHENRELLHHSF